MQKITDAICWYGWNVYGPNWPEIFYAAKIFDSQ